MLFASAFMQAANVFLQVHNAFLQAINTFMQPVNVFLQVHNAFLQAINTFMQPVNVFLQVHNDVHAGCQRVLADSQRLLAGYQHVHAGCQRVHVRCIVTALTPARQNVMHSPSNRANGHDTSYESRGARQVHNNTNQDNTFFKELPWVGLEPTTLCLLGRALFLQSYQQAGL